MAGKSLSRLLEGEAKVLHGMQQMFELHGSNVQPGNVYLLTCRIVRTVKEKCVEAQLNVHRYASSDPEIETHSQS